MTNLYIQVENGLPVNHPAYESNLLEAFGEIPANWESFQRISQPAPILFFVLKNPDPSYQKIDGVWKDVWAFRPMTDSEKEAKQQELLLNYPNTISVTTI